MSTSRRSTPRSCIPLALAALVSGILPADLSAQQSQSQAQATVAPSAVGYEATAEIGGSVVGSWSVVDGPTLSVARTSGVPVLLSGPALGSVIAAEVDARGFLVGRLAGGDGLVPGERRTSPYGEGTAIVDSLQVELEESGAAQEDTVAGRPARRVVLTARLWWRHQHDGGGETPVEEVGRAELWFAPDLPFSWLPLALAPGRPAIALPLSQSWPEMGGEIVRRLGSRLEPLGLLVRARVIDRVRPTDNPDAPTQLVGTDYERSVRLSDVRVLAADAAADTAVAALAALPRLSAARADAIGVASALLEDCRALASAAGGSAGVRISGGESPTTAEGFAVYGAGTAYEDGYPLVAGRLGAERGECLAVLLPADAEGATEWPVVPIGSDAPGARVAHAFVGPGGLARIVLLEEGTLELTAVTASRRAGRLLGHGWGLRLLPGERGVDDGLTVEASFDAVPAPEGSGL